MAQDNMQKKEEQKVKCKENYKNKKEPSGKPQHARWPPSRVRTSINQLAYGIMQRVALESKHIFGEGIYGISRCSETSPCPRRRLKSPFVTLFMNCDESWDLSNLIFNNCQCLLAPLLALYSGIMPTEARRPQTSFLMTPLL